MYMQNSSWFYFPSLFITEEKQFIIFIKWKSGYLSPVLTLK